MTTSVRCHSWALIGARTRVIDASWIIQAGIDVEASPPPPSTTAATSPLLLTTAAATAASSRTRHPPLDLNNQVMLTLLRWISSVVFSTSNSRGRRGVAAADKSDFEEARTGAEDEDEDEAEDEAEAAEAAKAMLAEVLEVLNAAPRHEGSDPIHRDTNLMDAGFDSLQVMVRN